MTQLRNLLERIASGSGPALGFGASPSAALPAMALVARCSGDLDSALAAAGDAADAVVIFAPGITPDAIPDLGGRIWGVGGAPLEPATVAAWQAAGADFTVSPLAGAMVDAINIASPAMTHGVRIPDAADAAMWRTLAGIPVDFLVLDKSGLRGRWTLTDAAQAADAARRTDKHLFVRLGEPATRNELAALRQAGVAAVVAEANALGAEGLAALKSDLLALPRIQPASRRRVQPGLDYPDHPAP